MKRRVRLIVFLGLALITMVAVISFGGQTANAKVKYYKTVPTALRGTWSTSHWKGSKVRQTFTKYTWKHSGQKLSMKAKDPNNRLGIYKAKSGYYVIGIAHGDMPARFKPVKHNGKKALRTYAYDYTKGKNQFFYYYKK